MFTYARMLDMTFCSSHRSLASASMSGQSSRELVGTNDPLHHASADPKLLGNLEDTDQLTTYRRRLARRFSLAQVLRNLVAWRVGKFELVRYRQRLRQLHRVHRLQRDRP